MNIVYNTKHAEYSLAKAYTKVFNMLYEQVKESIGINISNTVTLNIIKCNHDGEYLKIYYSERYNTISMPVYVCKNGDVFIKQICYDNANAKSLYLMVLQL